MSVGKKCLQSYQYSCGDGRRSRPFRRFRIHQIDGYSSSIDKGNLNLIFQNHYSGIRHYPGFFRELLLAMRKISFTSWYNSSSNKESRALCSCISTSEYWVSE